MLYGNGNKVISCITAIDEPICPTAVITERLVFPRKPVGSVLERVKSRVTPSPNLPSTSAGEVIKLDTSMPDTIAPIANNPAKINMAVTRFSLLRELGHVDM